MAEFGADLTSWSGFLSAARNVRGQLKNPDLVWYRGQSKANYDLKPSLLRRPNGLVKERALFDDFERSASHLFGAGNTDWAMLTDMQHYGIPTRLLDWTDVLGIAVAFALYNDADDASDSSVFLLDPVALNDLSGIEGVKRPANEPDFEYKRVYWDGKPFLPHFPIAVDGKLSNPRLRAQSGNFTIQGNSDQSLEVLAPDVIRKIVLPSAVKPEAREFLANANLNAFTIYPDIVGMAQYILRKHFS